MTTIDFAKWLAIGTGIGIEIGSRGSHCHRRPPSSYRRAECWANSPSRIFENSPRPNGAPRMPAFLQKLGVGHLAATILLPRDEVTVRQISLPGVTDKDLASAVRFEIDSLNPHSEEEVAYDWARIGKTSSVLIAITLRSVVERYTALFSQAGVKAACFTFSAPTIYSALRLLSTPPKDGFLVMEPAEDGLEVYGESATRPIFSARLDQPSDRVRTLAVSELRLPPETEAALLRDRLPQPLAQPESLRAFPRLSLVCRRPGRRRPPASAQLESCLPREQRQSASRLRYVPTAVLGSIVLLLAGRGPGLSQLFGSSLSGLGAGADSAV